MQFDLKKYLGVWYELGHYPSWFQRNDNYNTMARYTMNPDGSVKVHNSSISNGKGFDSYGRAVQVDGPVLRVDFEMPEIKNLTASGEFRGPSSGEWLDRSQPNYVVDRLWVDNAGNYVVAVVTDPSRKSLYVLSRTAHPALAVYNEVMGYVIANFDRDRLVQTPHY
jgi:apolipoprotein D and lipocalin family protein